MCVTLSDCEKYQKYLEKYEKRSQYLAKLIQIVNGSFLTIFLAFFTVSLNNNNDIEILIVCISILFFWRYYIHFIDDEMIRVYGRIIYCEDNLKIFDDKISLKKIFNKENSKKSLYPNRGQFSFDIFALLIMLALLCDYLFRVYNYEDRILWIIAFIEIGFYIVYFMHANYESKKEIEKLKH